MCICVERLNMALHDSGQTLVHPTIGDCRWLETLKHYLRTVLRDYQLTLVEKSRPILSGAETLMLRAQQLYVELALCTAL